MQISRRCSRRSIEQFFRIFAGEPNRRERNSFSREELRETNYIVLSNKDLSSMEENVCLFRVKWEGVGCLLSRDYLATRIGAGRAGVHLP